MSTLILAENCRKFKILKKILKNQNCENLVKIPKLMRLFNRSNELFSRVPSNWLLRGEEDRRTGARSFQAERLVGPRAAKFMILQSDVSQVSLENKEVHFESGKQAAREIGVIL